MDEGRSEAYRIQELLEANNKLEQRAREAERRITLYRANAISDFNRRLTDFDLVAFMRNQFEFSLKTFGPPSPRNRFSICDHIGKELLEIVDMDRPASDRLEEWIDVVILAIDGALREGATYEQICFELSMKLATNKTREWPDWRTADPMKAIEHVRK